MSAMNIKNRNKMKHILVYLLAFTLFTACDSDQDDLINPDEEQNVNPEEGNSGQCNSSVDLVHKKKS